MAWHAIRPWMPPDSVKSSQMTLSVREITSVSVTFVLSAELPEEASVPILDDDEQEKEEEPKKTPNSIVSRALSCGLTVDVDGTPWHLVLIRMHDERDESFIIVYGLMPGRQYDIELQLVNRDGGKDNMRRQVVTQPEREPESPSETPESSLSVDTQVDESEPQSPSDSPQPQANSNSLPQTTAPTPMTLEDRITHLQVTLSLLTTEHSTLTSQIKSTKLESRKADVSLRNEIDILKRSSEKHSAGEQRSRQRALALQEAIKRAQSSTKDISDSIIVLEANLPQLRQAQSAKESFFAKTRTEADRVTTEREEEEEKERRRLESRRTELASMNNKLEKLMAKREKLESATIPELEDELSRVREEIRRESTEFLTSFRRRLSSDDSEFIPPQRLRTQSGTNPGLIGRPVNASSNGADWSNGQTWQQQYSGGHNQRAASLHVTPTILTNPNRHKANGHTSSSNAAATSTLSSRAAPFEPGKPLQMWPTTHR